MKFNIKKIFLYFSIVFSILFFILWWLLSNYALKYINENSKTYLGQKAEIKDCSINLLSGSVHLYDLTVFEKNESDSLLNLKHLEVNFKIMQLINGQYRLDNVLVDGLALNIEQNDLHSTTKIQRNVCQIWQQSRYASQKIRALAGNILDRILQKCSVFSTVAD